MHNPPFYPKRRNCDCPDEPCLTYRDGPAGAMYCDPGYAACDLQFLVSKLRISELKSWFDEATEDGPQHPIFAEHQNRRITVEAMCQRPHHFLPLVADLLSANVPGAYENLYQKTHWWTYIANLLMLEKAYVCAVCIRTDSLAMHHKLPHCGWFNEKVGQSNTETNVAFLCPEHHMMVHADKFAAVKAAISKRAVA